MTTDSSAIVNTSTRKIEELERITAALTAAISRSRKTRLWILLGVILFLGVFLFMFWNLFSDVGSAVRTEITLIIPPKDWGITFGFDRKENVPPGTCARR